MFTSVSSLVRLIPAPKRELKQVYPSQLHFWVPSYSKLAMNGHPTFTRMPGFTNLSCSDKQLPRVNANAKMLILLG